jgi:N-dimethylarginine dimethylaminohydrolase
MTHPAQQPCLGVSSNPSRINRPAFLMSAPFSYSADSPNNVWMTDLGDRQREIDRGRALKQFLELYHYIAADALVYLLPSPADCGLQDLVFTANLGIVLEHLADKNTIVLSKFASPPRFGEAELGRRFFTAMGYEIHVPPFEFEGEAELKHLYDSVYIGGFGQRSKREAFAWMEREFGMTIIAIEERDPYLYHLDCTIYPIDRDNTMVCTEVFHKAEIEALERHTNIIDVSAEHAYTGICNSVRLANTIMNSSHIHELRRGTEDYAAELSKNRRLEDIAAALGFDVNFFNLSEYHKGGALLSCMVMHLNRISYDIALL